MPLVQTRGAASAQGFGEFAQAPTAASYIEDVFSTYLYTGNGSTQTITNNIDLSTKGGMVWIKGRSSASPEDNHQLYDTIRGAGKTLITNISDGQYDFLSSGALSAFNSNGFSLNGPGPAGNRVNASGQNVCSWTFREQPKFFDVVTYTGDGTSNRSISHNLGSTPGMIIDKATSTTGDWFVWNRTMGGNGLILNLTDAQGAYFATQYMQNSTSTIFKVNSDLNTNGVTYVAYLFAHDAGGFGTTGTDNVISCGGFTANGSGNATINLGYEPQYLLYKRTDGAAGWVLYDVMRGWNQSALNYLFANLADAEGYFPGNYIFPTATGLTFTNGLLTAGASYIYMTIRRPMKVPTVGTTVFSPSAVNVSAGTAVTTGFPIDWQINYYRSFAANYNSINATRLLGTSSTSTESGQVLWTSKTDAQTSFGMTRNWNNTGFQQTSQLWPNIDNIYWNFRRASGFFDVVVAPAVSGYIPSTAHNLGVVPELMIMKDRFATAAGWGVGVPAILGGSYLVMNTNAAAVSASFWSPTSTMTGDMFYTSGSAGQSVVVYLFATCAGVSKVGSYTGNGTTQAISCGFTGGARFVLIKRTDSTGDWYVYDTARGMTTLTDPYLLMNSTAAESATLGSVTSTAGGFTVNAAILAAINTNAASYIFLAIA